MLYGASKRKAHTKNQTPIFNGFNEYLCLFLIFRNDYVGIRSLEIENCFDCDNYKSVT